MEPVFAKRKNTNNLRFYYILNLAQVSKAQGTNVTMI